MALDHYVSQVHLKNFYSADLGGRKMFAFRKRDNRCFPCGSEDVCRIESGNTNFYLVDPRAVEDFLKDIEVRYNTSICKFKNGEFDPDSIFVLSGFISYIMTCSPTAMRLHSGPLQKMIEAKVDLHERAGRLPPTPSALGGKTLVELIDDGVVDVSIDKKYPQAIGMETMLDVARIFGNSNWELLFNKHADSPFFTSDFPIAVERSNDLAIVNRVIPLAPDLAVRILPTMNEARSTGDFSFPYFRSRKINVSRAEVRSINELIVRCAEDLVFSRHQAEWVLPFIKKNAAYRIECTTERIPAEDGHFLLSSMRVMRTR